MENGVVQTNGSPMFERKVEFHSATKRTFNGSSKSYNSEFRLETLNTKPDYLKAGSSSGGKVAKLDGLDFGFDPELNFEFTLRKIGAGLENLGNTCFLNSVLQCLTYTEPLAAYLQSGKHQISCHIAGFCALCAIQKHVSRALQSTGRILAPKDLVSNLRRISRSFRNARQEDAHEYMVNLLESMHKCCLPSGIPSESPNAYEKSLVHKIFGGRLRSQVKCLECFHCSNKFDPFLDLSLEIANADSLYKALKNFTSAEQLDGGERQYNCQQCKQKVRASKQLTVDKAPYVFSIHLKRFRAYDPGHKIDKKVQFYPTMDLKPFVTGPYEGDLKYTLYGVLVHYGWSTHSGHYYCFVRTSSGLWYSLDDNQVVQVSEMTVLQQKAYMLFYVRDRKSSAIRKPTNFSQIENQKTDVRENKPFLNLNHVLKESIQNGANQRMPKSADSTPSVKKDVLGFRLTKDDFAREASTVMSSKSVSASSLPEKEIMLQSLSKDPVQQSSSKDPMRQSSPKDPVQQSSSKDLMQQSSSKDTMQQSSSKDTMQHSSLNEVDPRKGLSEEKPLASSDLSITGNGCVEQKAETVIKETGANSQDCSGDLGIQSSSKEVDPLKGLSEEKPLACLNFPITGKCCVEQNAETFIKESGANCQDCSGNLGSQKYSDVSLMNSFDCFQLSKVVKSVSCQVLADGTDQKLEPISHEEVLHKDSSQHREPPKLEVALGRPTSKPSPDSIQDNNSILINRNTTAACGKTSNYDQKSAHESVELPSSSNLSSESLIVKASCHTKCRIFRRRYMNGWTAGMSMGAHILLRANVGPQKKKTHKRSRSGASSSRKLIQEPLRESESISSGLGPSTSEKASETYGGRKMMKSQSKKKADKIAKKARKPRESLVVNTDRELYRKVDQNGAVLATDMNFQDPLYSNAGAGHCGTNGPNSAEDCRRDAIQHSFLNMLTRGLEETVVARWNGIDIPAAGAVGSTQMEDVSIGYMPDKWDEEYDRGKRKKPRHGKHGFTYNGPNPFQQIANNKSKLKRSGISGNEPFRIN